MTTQLDNIDQRLAQLVTATEGLLQVTSEQGQQQRKRFEQQMSVLQAQGQQQREDGR